MATSALLIRAFLGASVAFGTQFSISHSVSPVQPLDMSEYAALPKCPKKNGKEYQRAKTTEVAGVKKTAKSLKCLKKSDISAGKKLLNGFSNACFACHSTFAQWNPTVMVQNLRAQGDGTLKIANIVAVNNAHLAEMSGSVATAKQLAQVRAYLLSLKE